MPQPRAQVLIYPAVDARCAADSYARLSDGFALTSAKMAWFWRLYLPAEEAAAEAARAHPLVSPLLAADLARLPPALVVLADADVLHDEGAAYAAALARAGGAVDVQRFCGELHGFVGDAENPASEAAIAAVAQWLRALPPPPMAAA